MEVPETMVSVWLIDHLKHDCHVTLPCRPPAGQGGTSCCVAAGVTGLGMHTRMRAHTHTHTHAHTHTHTHTHTQATHPPTAEFGGDIPRAQLQTCPPPGHVSGYWPIISAVLLQWKPLRGDTLNLGHLSSEDSATCPSYVEMSTKLPLK